MFGFGHKSKIRPVPLTDEQEQLLREAQQLVEETRQRAKKPEDLINLTSVFQLRDDCKMVEQLMDRLQKKPDAAAEEALQKGVIRLKTTSEAILNWEFNFIDKENSR